MSSFVPRRPSPAARTELVLRLADGSPWRLVVSPGVERFIGYYPRVPGLGADGPLLSYRTVVLAG